jgi:hypothetical protein
VIRILKYEISPEGICEMPDAHQLLKVAAQGDRVFCWAAVEDTRNVRRKRFIVVPTGCGIGHVDGSDLDPATLKAFYIDTVFVGPLVFHVFRQDALVPFEIT